MDEDSRLPVPPSTVKLILHLFLFIPTALARSLIPWRSGYTSGYVVSKSRRYAGEVLEVLRLLVDEMKLKQLESCLGHVNQFSEPKVSESSRLCFRLWVSNLICDGAEKSKARYGFLVSGS